MQENHEVVCPYCGAVQATPLRGVALNCVSCGQRFSPTNAMPSSGATSRTVVREILCHKCKESHTIPRYTRSTKCPHCDATIVVGDVSLIAPAKEPLDLRGRLWIGMKASLGGHSAVCSDAIIEGKLGGDIFCENSIEFRSNEKITHRIEVKKLRIASGVCVEFPNGGVAEDIEIEGTMVGNVLAYGQVIIGRTGQLHGNVSARSVHIERGGVWSGAGKIGETE